MTSGRQPFPVSRMRAAIARGMTASKQNAPHFYVSTEVVMDPVLDAVRELNEGRDPAERATVTAFLVKAAAVALQEHPAFNVVWGSDGPEIVSAANVAIAIALDDGLIAPALLDVGALSVPEISGALRDLIGRAKAGRLRAAELSSGTFTLTNLGMFDVTQFSAIITPPQVAILATGRAVPRAVVEAGVVVVRQVMTATLSADHRIVDGAGAARFLETFKAALARSAAPTE